MSKISKLLVMLLALVMVVSLIAGCKPATQIQQPNNSQGENNNNDKPNGDNGDETPTTTLPEAEDEFTDARIIWNDIFPLEEPITFTMAARGDKDYQTLVEKCEWYKYLVEKTNVHLNVITLGTDYVGKLNTLVTTGSAPDVVLGPITVSSAQVVALAEQGQLVAIEDYITDPEIMPNYQRILKAIPEMLNKMYTPDGHIYSVAGRGNSIGGAWESPLSVNIDWLKQVPGYEDGKTFPKTVEEFTDVLRFFKANDMNGNGDATDEIPFLFFSSSTAPGDAQATLQGLMNLWGLGTKDGSNEYYVHIPCDDEEGEVTIAPTTQNYRDCLKWVNVWYEEGLLWENFFQKMTSKDLAAVSGNATASWGFFNGAAWWNNGPYYENPSQPWADAQTLVEPFDTGYHVHYFINPAVTGNLNNFTIFNTCENPEILLAWYDIFMSLEGTLTVYKRMPNEWQRYEDKDLYKEYYEQYPTWHIDDTGMPYWPSLVDPDNYIDLNVYDAELADKLAADHPSWSSIFNSNAVFKGVTDSEFLVGAWPDHEHSEARVLGQWIEDHPDYFNYNIWPRPYSTADEAEVLTEFWPQVFGVIQTWEADFIMGKKDINSDADWEEFQADLVDAGSEELIETLAQMWDRVK